MAHIGKLNRLLVVEKFDGTFFLDGGAVGRIPLLRSPSLSAIEVGRTVEAFIYPDSTGALVGTLEKPFIEVGQCACLNVLSIESIGAFLDWGLPKNLFLPFSEQIGSLQPGDRVVVFAYLDKAGRVCASMRIENQLSLTKAEFPLPLREGQEVSILIFAKTPLGYKAVINDRGVGMIYQNEIFREIQLGDSLKAFVKTLRDDGKIDLSLQQSGYRGIEDFTQIILTTLEQQGGFLSVTDKSTAEEISQLFQMSKKKYKMAIGTLYKKGLISLESNGIRLKNR